MNGVEVSPWTLRYVAVSLGSFVLAQMLLVLGAAYPAVSVSDPTTLATVHLVTIGWLTLLMLGVLHQFIPVIGAHKLHSQRANSVTFWLVSVGLLLLILGFLALPGGPLSGAGATDILLPVGGSLVVVGVLVAIWNLLVTLLMSRPLRLPALYVSASLMFLALTVLLGLSFAAALTLPGLLPPAVVGALLTRGLPLHLLGGIGGWFGLTAMGVADRLLAMFSLAPEERGRTRHWALRLTVGGIALAWLAGLLLMFNGSILLEALGWTGWAALLAGVALYLVDMRELYRRRRRKDLEANAAFGRVALWALGITAVLTAASGALGDFASIAPALVYALLFGWLSGLALSQLYKIVPFLTWLERYGKSLGKVKVPRVQDLVVERRARPIFWMYFTGALLGTLAMLAGSAWLLRVGATVTEIATLGIAREIWLVRHPKAEPIPGGQKSA